jgi:hypothetical protein
MIDTHGVAVEPALEFARVFAQIVQAALDFRQRTGPEDMRELCRLVSGLHEVLGKRLPRIGGLPRYRMREVKRRALFGALFFFGSLYALIGLELVIHPAPFCLP